MIQYLIDRGREKLLEPETAPVHAVRHRMSYYPTESILAQDRFTPLQDLSGLR